MCALAKSPDGCHRPARGTNPHKHKTEWEMCTDRAPTPHQKHASARVHTVYTWGGGLLALCSCADKMDNGPWISCLWINEGPVSSGPSSLLCSTGCGGCVTAAVGLRLYTTVWNLVVWSQFTTAGSQDIVDLEPVALVVESRKTKGH